MIKPKDYHELATIIARRSPCNVQVGAVIYDSYGVFAWGWNNAGSGYGEHAEAAAIRRANKSRLSGATILVVSIRKTKYICSMPCPKCAARIAATGISKVTCAAADGEWLTFRM